VLGDEASLTPSSPVGPLKQPFVQTAANRRSGVVFDYVYRDEVELKLRWPEGWKVESAPQAINVSAARAAALTASVELHPEERTLVYKRRVDVIQRQLGSIQEYEWVRNLFTEVEKSDAQKLVLVKR